MFRVDWLQTALDEFARSWGVANPSLRQAITRAAHQVDLHLESNPEGVGESREPNRRVHIVDPLVVTYEIDREQSVVTVVSVRVFRHRR